MVLSNSTSIPKGVIKFDDLVGVLLSEDMIRKNISNSSGVGLVVVDRGRTQQRGKDNQRKISNSTKRSQSRGRKGVCW